MTPEAIATHAYDPYAGAETGWFGDSIVRAVKKGVKTAVHAVKSVSKIPAVRSALSAAEVALKNSGPWGMAANAAVQALGAGLAGKNIEQIAWAAAEGAAPTGIDRALAVAHQLRSGRNVLSVALGQARAQFLPGSAAIQGFDIATDVLKRAASKSELGAARRALGSEEARRAFDVAVGTLSRTAPSSTRTRLPAATGLAARRKAASLAHTVAVRTGRRALSVPDPLTAMRATSLPRLPFTATNHAAALVHAAVARNPILAAQSPKTVARALGLPIASTARALVSAPRVLPFRSLSPEGASFVRRFAPYASTLALHDETAGLVDDNTVYVVEAGDYLTKIAQKLIGNVNRYRELMAANPQYAKSADGSNFKNVWVGMRLKLPASWIPIVNAASSSAPTTVTAPAAPAVTESSAATVLQAKATLAAWNVTDGAGAAGVPDYGSNASDLSADWGARDRLLLASFSNWSNRTRSTSLATDGSLTAAHADALRAWAEAKATQAVTPVVLPVTVPALPPAPTLPSSGSFPDVPTEELPPLVVTGAPPPGIPELYSHYDPNVGPMSPGPVLPAPANHPALPPVKPKKKGDDGLIVPVGLALAFLV